MHTPNNRTARPRPYGAGPRADVMAQTKRDAPAPYVAIKAASAALSPRR